jgi:hypothetical protein
MNILMKNFHSLLINLFWKNKFVLFFFSNSSNMNSSHRFTISIKSTISTWHVCKILVQIISFIQKKFNVQPLLRVLVVLGKNIKKSNIDFCFLIIMNFLFLYVEFFVSQIYNVSQWHHHHHMSRVLFSFPQLNCLIESIQTGWQKNWFECY